MFSHISPDVGIKIMLQHCKGYTNQEEMFTATVFGFPLSDWGCRGEKKSHLENPLMRVIL